MQFQCSAQLEGRPDVAPVVLGCFWPNLYCAHAETDVIIKFSDSDFLKDQQFDDQTTFRVLFHCTDGKSVKNVFPVYLT